MGQTRHNKTDGTGRDKGKDKFLKGMKGTKARRGKGFCRFQKIIRAEGVLYRGFFVYLQEIGMGLAGQCGIFH